MTNSDAGRIEIRVYEDPKEITIVVPTEPAPSQLVTKEEFKRQMDIAASIVEKWPLWKQNLLADSASPTVRTPRKSDHESNQIGYIF